MIKRDYVGFTVLGALIAAVAFWGGMATGSLAAKTDTGNLTVWADYACYRVADDPSVTEVEFVFAFKRHEFTFVGEPDGSQMAQIGLWVQLMNMQGQPVTDTISAYFGAEVGGAAEAQRPDYKVFYALPLQIPPGLYRARIIALDSYSDENNRQYGELVMPLVVRDFSAADLAISDIKLAYDIDVLEETDPNAPLDVLVRNQRKVFPDPRGILSRNRPRLYFYGEIYNLAYEPGGDNVYELGFRFLTEDSTTIRDFGTRAYKKPGTSSVLATGLPIGDMPEGNFLLEVTVTDPASNRPATAIKPFTIVLESAGVDSLTPEQAERMRNVILFLARKDELETYDGLSLTGKKNFLIKFWKRFDPTPGTAVNEFRDEHYRRINYANEQFSTSIGKRVDGWSTDRGRIYIKYGPPDETEIVPSTMEEKPYEKWYYYQFKDQGEVYFILVDEDGFGNLKLVHSTARGERHDPEWAAKIKAARLERY